MTAQLLSPTRLSDELRNDASPDMQRRRLGIAFSLGGALIGGVVSAYQTGLIKRLPDILPGAIFDAEKVDASDYAYQTAQMPDGVQMLTNYGLTAMAIAAGGAARSSQNPALPLVASGKALFDVVICGALAVAEWRENRKLCSWCQIATVLSVATLALSLPEARRAVAAINAD